MQRTTFVRFRERNRRLIAAERAKSVEEERKKKKKKEKSERREAKTSFARSPTIDQFWPPPVALRSSFTATANSSETASTFEERKREEEKEKYDATHGVA